MGGGKYLLEVDAFFVFSFVKASTSLHKSSTGKKKKEISLCERKLNFDKTSDTQSDNEQVQSEFLALEMFQFGNLAKEVRESGR